MADSVFSAEDRVDNEALPPELVGKTAKEIAQYYARREQILSDRLSQAERTPAPQRETAPAKPEVKFDMFNDPEGSVNRVVNQRVNEALANATGVIGPGVIGGIKVSMGVSHKDWSKFGAEVEKRMSGFTPESQMNPVFWENTYLLVKGENADRMVEEAVNSAKNPIERPTNPGNAPAAPRNLTAEERAFAANMDISDDDYRDASARLESDGRGRFSGPIPLTVNNKTNGRKKAS